MVEVPRELLETLQKAWETTKFATYYPPVLADAARAVIDATPLRAEDVVPHVCNAAHPDDCTKPDHPELTVTVLLCQSCGKQIGQSISAGTLDLSDFNPATAVADFTEEQP